MTVSKLSSFPAALYTNVRRPIDFRFSVPRSRPARKLLARSAAKSPARTSPARKSRDANVALIMAVMMGLVFAPVAGMHLFATFGPADLGAGKASLAAGKASVGTDKASTEVKPAAEVVSRTVPALPPG